MTEFKYCVYCEDEPVICFNTEADAMKFARENTNTYSSVKVEKSEIDEAGDALNTEVIWAASDNDALEKETVSDNEFETEFPASDINDINGSDDVDYEEMANQYQEDPADWIDDGKLIKEAVDALEENEDEVECKVCFELGPKAEMKRLDIGYVCPKCAQEMQSHQGTNLDLIDNDPFSLDYEDPRDFDEPEEIEAKEEPVNGNEVRKFEAGIEENLEEHINDRPADAESEQALQGADNAVVDCETDQKLITHSEDEKPLDCKMEKPALEEPLAGEEVDAKLNEELKVIIDFSDYKPWSGAVDTYELIRDANKLDDLEAYLEDCYPEGVTAGQINDILWFDSDQVLQYLGLGDTEEDEEIDESLKEYWWEDDDPMNWSDKEPLVYSCYYDYKLLGYLEYPYMGYENYPTTIEADIAKYFELPDGYNPEDISWQNVEWEDQLDETKPLIKVEESLKEAKKDDELPPDQEAIKLEVHDTLNSLVSDEIATVANYEDAKTEIAGANIEHKDEIIDKIDKVEDDTKEHIDELIDAAGEIPFDKEDSPVKEIPTAEEPVEEPLNQDFPEVEESLEEAVAKPEADKVACYNDGLKLAKVYNKPVIYGYTNKSYGGKFFKLDDPIVCDNVSDETKKFRRQYKSCNVAYVAYPSGQLIERLLEELPEGATEVDYVEYKHSYCHALEPKLEELKKIEDIEELRKAILDIINNDPQVNWTKKEKKFAAVVRHKKWKSAEDLKAYLDNSIARAREIKVLVGKDGELVKKLAEEIEFDENGDEIFTTEEQEEFDCDEWGYSNEGYDQFHHCGWCEEVFPESDMRHEVDFGWICDRCEAELKSHGGPLTFIEEELKK